MHRAISFISKRFVQIRPGEERKVFLTFAYFFLVITSYYLIKPVSRSLVLGELGSRMVPYVDLVCALMMGPFVAVFARFVDRMPKPRLVSASFWTVIGILIVFWGLMGSPAPAIAAIFYIWVSIFSVLVVTLFWLVANDLFRPQEAKRLFGFIGSGGILGGIVGSSIAAVGAQLIGTQHLLLVSAGLLVVCWMVVQRLWAFAPDRTEEGPAPLRRESLLSNVGDFARLILSSRYLLLLITMVGLNKLIATLVYYQLNPFIEQAFPGQDARTTFTGMFLGGMNVLSFIIQFFCTSWVLRRMGLSVALLALPVGVLAGTTALVFAPGVWLAALTELYDGSMNYSLQQTTKEVLYLPIDRSIRYKVKPFIDMVMFRFGKGIAAVIGIVLLDVLGVPPVTLSFVCIPLLMAWIVTAIWLRRDYITTIRTVLQARAASLRPRGVAGGSDAEVTEAGVAVGEPEPYGSLLNGLPSRQKLELIQQALDTEAGSSNGKALLETLTAYETRMASSLELEGKLHRLKAVISDQGEPMARRRRAVRSLTQMGGQSVADHLIGMVIVEEDAILRQEAVTGLLRLRLGAARLEFPVQPIRRQIAREVANYQHIVHLVRIYRQHGPGPLPSTDPILALFKILLQESVEQIFRLLMLLYRPEDIHLVYEQLRAPESFLRSDAVELLDNLVDPSMRAMIFPILDEERFLSVVEEPAGVPMEPAIAYRLLQNAIWDHNCWLSVTTLCAVGRMRMAALQPDLERASRHAVPVISSAARLAIQWALAS